MTTYIHILTIIPKSTNHHVIIPKSSRIIAQQDKIRKQENHLTQQRSQKISTHLN